MINLIINSSVHYFFSWSIIFLLYKKKMAKKMPKTIVQHKATSTNLFSRTNSLKPKDIYFTII